MRPWYAADNGDIFKCWEHRPGEGPRNQHHAEKHVARRSNASIDYRVGFKHCYKAPPK